MQRIGLFGGTFNPIHEGHVHLAAALCDALKLDTLYFIPDAAPPHKNAAFLADKADRYQMCLLAALRVPNAKVSDYELKKDEKSYTLYTVRYFKEQNPDAELFLLVGGDMFVTVDRWYGADELLSAVTVCAGARTSGEYGTLVSYAKALEARGLRAVVADLAPYAVSSTDIRESLRTGMAHEALPEPVRRYIETAHPYGGQPPEYTRYESLLRRRLTPKRFYHSQCVAKEAAALAIRFGGDERKAYTAGLLHDIAKDMPGDEQLQTLQKFAIILDSTEKVSPKLWHAMAGACIVQELGINDVEIINAIRYHTTAREGMTLLERIIYLADYISFDRDFDDAAAIRERLRLGLDSAMMCALALSVKGLAKKELPIHIDTIRAYNSGFCAAEVNGQRVKPDESV